MTLFYRKLLGVPESYHPSLEIPERRANFPIFLWQKSPGKDLIGLAKVKSLHLNSSPALPEFSQGTHPWGRGGGKKSLSGITAKESLGFLQDEREENTG